MPITPEQFKTEWLAVSEEYRLNEAVVANWAWNDNERRRNERRLPPRGQVTNDDITRAAERALFDIAEDLKLGITWECPPIEGTRRKLDAVLFSDSKDGPRTPEVAWEHENNRQNCDDEVTRLREYGAPLSVLVTYLRPYRTKTDRVGDWLPTFHREFGITEVGEKQFLVIFAAVDGEWRFYEYQRARFVELH
jgi:hypothetical protein